MKKIIICDDDSSFRSCIKAEISKNISDIELVCFDSGYSMLDSGEVQDAYGCFLDIELGGEDGIEVAIELCKQNRNIKIFFISNYESLVFRAIHARPVRFIRKKYFLEEMKEAINYIKNEWCKKDESVVFKSGNKEIELSKNQIMYIESNAHYINIFCKNNVSRVRGKVSEYYENLKKMDFVQIQKGIVINMEYIDQICRDSIVLKNGEKFNISRNMQEIVNKTIMEFLRKEVE